MHARRRFALLTLCALVGAALLVGCDGGLVPSRSTPTATPPQVRAPLGISPSAGRSNAAAFYPTPPPFTLPPPTGGPPPAVIRRILDVARRGDEAGLQAMFKTRRLPCAPANGEGWRVCGPNEAPGTPVESFTIAQGCNASEVDRATAVVLTSGLLARGVEPVAAALDGDRAARAGERYVVVFKGSPKDNGIFGVYADDTGVTHIRIGCSTPESLLRGAGGTLGALFDIGRP
ncbi:MAG: hypothetical protein WCI61_11210 [Chloroflexota bacterium]